MHISTLKKHKILLLILFSFMLTGCSVDYTLELNDKVKETIKVNASGDINEIEQELEILTPVVDVFEEGHNYRKLKNGNTLTYSYTYDVDSFSEAFVADSCFDDFNFEEDENFYVLTAKGKFGCLYDNTEVKLNVVTDKYVSEVGDESIKKLHQKVSNLKKSREWEEGYMKMEELIEHYKEVAREIGRAHV